MVTKKKTQRPDRKPIAPLALLVVVNKGKILVSKALDGSFIRPPGGHIEYLENSKTAVIRETKEEIRSGVKNLKLEKIIENLFYFKGKRGHDINFIYSGELTNKYLYKKEVVLGNESGVLKKFYWVNISDITHGKENLVPKGILEVVLRLSKKK